MKVSKAAKIGIDYHKTHSKKNTLQSYQFVTNRFCLDSEDREIEQITADDILIPKKVADRLRDYAIEVCKSAEYRISQFPMRRPG
jgi:hypothetical protein